MVACAVIVGLILAVDGGLMAYLTWAFHSEKYAPYRFQEPLPRRQTVDERRSLQTRGSVLSLVMLGAWLWFGAGTVLVEAGQAAWVIGAHALGILAVYDFFYYAMHRFVFHHPRLMKWIHGTHHAVRYPTAEDSLWTHPIETFLGIGLLMATTAASGLVAPVHPLSFALAFAVWSPMNVINHMGIAFPRWHPLSVFNHLARAHYGHHKVDIQKNFATLTTVYDRLLGTAV